MLTVLGGRAEFERHLILTRTTEGRQRAHARGLRFGRKRKLTVHQQQETLARRAAGEALVDIARSYAVSHSTIFEARRWWAMRRYCALISTNAELDVAALGQLSGVLIAPRRPAQKPNEATNSPSPSAHTQAWGCFL